MFLGTVSRMCSAVLVAAATAAIFGLLSLAPPSSLAAATGDQWRLPFTSLSSVSCVATGWCAAVGRYTPSNRGEPVALAERWNGRNWMVASAQNPRRAWSSSLAAVSCTSSRACVAVGDYSFGKGCGSYASVPCSAHAIAEVWNGESWKLMPVPLSALASQGGSLSGVSCATARFCVAVGGYEYGSGCTNYYGQGPCNRRTIIERWNGKRWRDLPTPAGIGALSAVSCSSSRACIAVGGPNCFAMGGGSVCSGSGGAPAERWNGRGWSLEAVPGGITTALNGVSCVSARSCTAVGNYAPPSAPDGPPGGRVPLDEQWNGATWTVEQTTFRPPSSVAPQAYLDGVSCSSPRLCFAVGHDQESGTTLAERWDGATWTVQPSPNPPNTETNALSSVSCTSAVRCIAVGISTYPDIASLAEAWNGTQWRIQRTA